jgi:nucleoside-diphosphate-sugar epimerase
VIGVDCFTDYYPRPMKEQNLGNIRENSRFTFVEGDLLDLDLTALMRGAVSYQNGHPLPVDWVFHLAAQAGVRASWGNSFDVYARNNVLATQRLLEAAKGAVLKKFVYASSSSVYGDAEQFPTSECVTPHLISPYGVTKLAGEHLGLLYWRNYSVPIVCLRYFTVYGPRQRPDMAFHRFIRAMLEGHPIVIYGDGEQTRDFTFVSDTVDGTVRAAQEGTAGDVFNIGGGSRVTVNQVIRELEAIINQHAYVQSLESQKGDAHDTAADIVRANSLLGYMPRTPLSDGLQVEVAWLERSISAEREAQLLMEASR